MIAKSQCLGTPERAQRAAQPSRGDPGLVDRVRHVGAYVVLAADDDRDLLGEVGQHDVRRRAVGRRASTGSVTVLGDLAQATTPWATSSWAESMGHLGHPEAEVEELVAGFRVPGAVIDFAADPVMGPDTAPLDKTLYKDGLHPTDGGANGAGGQGKLALIYARAVDALLK